ncbi:MAG TPA: MFS transporter [Flexivirga sp.]|uniref:MFS transporter n=1 Tax=Flexivirga sp. TaxID=1962927 RepID=UPI002BD4AE9A|nr:MFS transporter [Flexivirga sp.]HWC24674.1 MFS transporter [Flexivirga sp.]
MPAVAEVAEPATPPAEPVLVEPPAQPPTARSPRVRWIALTVLCTGMLMIVLDGTVVNVALPAIQHDLGFAQGDLAWVVNAYLISFAGLLLLAGRLGDLVSRRTVFLTGISVFTVASLLCGLSWTSSMLVAARFLQGVGGAMTSAVILGMIFTMFPEPREQARAIGVFAFVASAGGAIGLLAGGALTQLTSWHLVFLVNLPIGIVTLFAAVRFVPRDQGTGFGAGLDVLGAGLVTAALMAGVYTIVKPAAEHGWTDGATLTGAAVTALLLAAFVWRQAKATTPLLPLRIFRSRNVVGANLIQCLIVAGMFGLFFLGVLYLQQVQGYDALHTGIAFLPLTALMALVSVRYAEPLTTRFGPRPMLLASMTAITIGLALWTRVPVEASYLTDILPAALVLGLGAAAGAPAVMMYAMSGSSAQDAGVASGLINTSMQVGGAVGLAVLSSAATSRTRALSHGGVPDAAALTAGYHLGFMIAAGLVITGIVIALLLLRDPAKSAPSA